MFQKSYICVFFISRKEQNWFLKNFHNSGVVGHRKLPDPFLSNVFNLLPIGFRYIFSFEWYDFGLKYLVTGQPPKFKGQPPKFKASIRELPISEKAVSATWHADSDLVISMELKRKSTVVHVLFEPVSVSKGTEIYLSHGMEWDIISFQLQRVWIYYLICIYLIRSWCIIDSTFLFLTSNTFLVNNFTIERWLICRHSTAVFYSFKSPCHKLIIFNHIRKYYNKIREIWFMA